MKVYVISDIHGSLKYLNDFMNIYDKESKLIILGDILYHGPRNDLPLEYNPKGCINVLNDFKDKILWIKGNCDAEVDEMVLDFKCYENYCLNLNGYNFYLHHGHKEIKNFDFDVVLSGHTHVNLLKKENNIIYGNPGSLSIPKEGSGNSFMIINDEKITIYNLNEEILYEMKI